MNDKRTGGPAFPKAGLDPWAKAVEVQTGMTLRDYFAASAMQGMLGSHKWDANELARHSYAAADAMLAAREAS